MTISTTESRISYNGNGVTTVFSFPYRFLANGDLVVVEVSAAGVETVKTLTTHYTLTGAGDDAGGSVTMLVAPATGTRLVIYRDTGITQETDYISGDPFPAETHERALDRLTMIAQEIGSDAGRAIKVPVGDSSTLSTTLPASANRLDKFVVFDATTGAVELSTVTQTQVASAVAAAYAAGSTADAVTFIQAGTGAVSRTVQSKMREAVSVTDFGAVGDGSTDDTAAIQAALTSSAANVYFGDATKNYAVTAELTSSVAGRVIFGHGAKISPSSAIADVDYALVVTGAGSRVEGINFVGDAGVTVCGALFLGASGIAVQNNVFSDFENGGGIVGNSTATNATVTHNRLTNCNPVELGGDQYGSIHINGDNSTISENTIIDCDLTGVSTSGADALRILGNYMIGASGSTTSGGIIMDGAGVGCVIANNTVKRMAVEGIQIANNDGVTLAATTDHIISGNIIDDCDVSGITLAGTTATSLARVTIQGNHISSALTTARGIELVRGLKLNISGNYVYGYGTGLSVVQASPDLNVVGNTFENQTTTAISAGAQYMNIAGNKIVGILASTTGITFNGAATAGDQLITGNQIRNCLSGITGTFSGSQRTYIYNNSFIGNTADMTLTSQTTNSTHDNVFDKPLSGEFTLVAGSATVSNAQLLATDKIEMWKKTAGGTAGAVYVNAITAGVSFTVASTSGADTSTFHYALVR